MYNYAKISWYKIEKIIQCFCIDITASKTAALLGMNRNTINHWFNVFRRAIYAHQMKEFEKIFGEAEVDESYFGANIKYRGGVRLKPKDAKNISINVWLRQHQTIKEGTISKI